jgi:4-hydroxythreonine-4-phosphate dehydrogenase
MGDAAGIGPEITLAALTSPEVTGICAPVVYGDLEWMRETAQRLGLPVRIGAAGEDSADVTVLQATDTDLSDVVPGALSGAAGRAGVECVVAAAEAALRGEVDAIVTAPLNKEAMALGGRPYPGHTELLAQVTGTERYGMLLLSGPLRVVHVSTHVSLREAIERVQRPRILECIQLGHRACLDLGIAAPRIAVAGLNPHAGEHGLFGYEEIEFIAPAIAEARAQGIDATGPHPPDTIFAMAARELFDLVVAMYHDQGHIPVKLHGFDQGVNVTIGLPIIRTSVDHGTAFDIAGKGLARPDSMIEAIKVAVRMIHAARNRSRLHAHRSSH